MPLASHEYYTLVELIIFQIELPLYGMARAKATLQQMPLTNRVRDKFSERLTQIRNLVVADVQLTNGEDLSMLTVAKKDDDEESKGKEEESKEEVKTAT